MAALVVGGGGAAPAHAESEPGRCPETVIVAACGSEQNEPDNDVVPTQYNPGQPASNGWEAHSLRHFFQLVEYRHPGAFGDTFVLGLPPEYYPAAFPSPALNETGEDLTSSKRVQSLARIVAEEPPHRIAYHALAGFADSMATAVPGIPRAVADYEAATGCAPRYVLAGYSQGAMVLGITEQTLDRQTGGRVAGVFTFGAPPNPIAELPGGLLENLPPVSSTPATDQRLNFCRTGDVVCAPNLQNLATVLSTGELGAHDEYFQAVAVDPTLASPEEQAVADTFATWLAAP